jgi:hypothetical protein
MSKFVDNLKGQAEENPLLAITAGVAVFAAANLLISLISGLWGRKTWSKEVARRAAKTLK